MKLLKKILIVMVAVVLLMSAAFGVYVSIYYHAVSKDYASKMSVNKQEADGYIIYGDTAKSDTAFIFYPGAKVEAESYEPVLSEIADDGICVFLVEMPFRLAVLDVNAADDIIDRYHNDIQNWYIGGHSLGGAMAASYASEHVDQLSGLILMAAYPTSTISDKLPVLSLYGDRDGVLNMHKYNKAKALNVDMEEYVIKGGNHAGFGNYGEQKGDNTATIASEQQWQEAADEVSDFAVSS